MIPRVAETKEPKKSTAILKYRDKSATAEFDDCQAAFSGICWMHQTDSDFAHLIGDKISTCGVD